MKLTTFNIPYGFGAAGRSDLHPVAYAIRARDLVALQEVERHWSRTNRDDQPVILSTLLPDHHIVYGPAFDMALPDDRTNRRQFGTMILSRWPNLWSRTRPLPKPRMPNPPNTPIPHFPIRSPVQKNSINVFTSNIMRFFISQNMFKPAFNGHTQNQSTCLSLSSRTFTP